MNRNTNQHFAQNPVTIDIPRSRAPRNFDVKGTCDAGAIIPFYWDEIIPGSTHSMDTAKLFRMQTPLFPVMDDIFVDVYHFFVPMRLLWTHWQEFLGENSSDAWVQTIDYTIPQITSPASTGWTAGTLADYMGLPTGVAGLSVSALPFRCYARICQDWFRDENLTDPLNIPTGDSTQTGSNGTSYVNDVANGGAPFIASKVFDQFTGALPAPQKGPAVEINLGTLNAQTIPVYGNGYALALNSGANKGYLASSGSNNYQLYGEAGAVYHLVSTTPEASTGTLFGPADGKSLAVGVQTKANLGTGLLERSGLVGDLSGVSGETLITINQLRQAFQLQKSYEKAARGGSRYIEILKSFYGVTSPDERLQRPEYLGGSRIHLNMNQVIATSDTTDRPQGSAAAYSLTTDYHSDFTRSFTEHGIMMGVFVIRYNHSYQQGINKMWSHKTRLDIYNPIFANLGEVGIKNKEIYAQGSSVVNSDTGVAFDEEIFGYQEAWFEYRYKPSYVCAEMRSNYSASLDAWHLADNYSSLPALSDGWIREDAANINRTLAVSNNVSHQFYYDIYCKDMVTNPMPLYSIPGLIDHH